MRFATTLLILTQLAFSAFSQPGFNRIYDLGYPRNQFRNLIVYQDTIIAFGIARTDTFPDLQCLFLARFDSSGTAIDSKLICDSIGDYLSMNINWAEIISTSDGGYALTAASIIRNNGVFVKLSQDLSVEFIQEYPDSVNLVEIYNSIVELPDGYLLGGYVQRPNYLQDAFLRKVDKQGNSVWFSYYGEYDVVDFFSNYYKLNDSIVAYVGGYILNQNILDGRGPWLALVNVQDGEVTKEWRPSGSYLEWLHYIYPISSKNWLLYGKKAFQANPTKVMPFWALVDTSFNVIDTRLFGPGLNVSNFLWDMKPTPDGSFITVGQVNAKNPNTEPTAVYGWVYKVSPDLDSLWSLQVIPPVGDPKNYGGYLGGVGILSSGNMIAGGYANSIEGIHPWLVKFTPDGCIDTLWCATTPVWEPQELEWHKQPVVQLYPNPAQGFVTVELPDYGTEATLELFSVEGRVCLRQSVPNSGSIDVSQLVPGYYVCRVTMGESQAAYYAPLIIAR
ncbi:MAG: T9SS type A sorting domain-containing protein [Saprospiraceae bacterium]|nr:T9SS type A sorting domain-containing protein [Saprospiraceae bacterium]